MTARACALAPRRGRGFTLLEVVIVIVFTSVLILMMLGWVMGLVSTSTSMLSKNASSSDLSYLASTFGQDATGAVVCASDGLGVPFYSFSATSVGLFEPNASGGIDLVLWQVNGSTIQRADVPSANGGCVFDTSSPTWVTIASNVTSGQFVPWYQGSSAQLPPLVASGGSCAGVAGSANAPEGCLFDSVELKVSESGAVAEAGVKKPLGASIDSIFSINLSGSRLA